jgi:hypothetical protein
VDLPDPLDHDLTVLRERRERAYREARVPAWSTGETAR